MKQENDVVITGCGWVTPFAVGSIHDVLEHRPALPLAKNDAGYASIPDEFVEGDPTLADELRRDRTAWVAALGLGSACRQAGLDLSSINRERVGLIVGSALAGQLGMIAFADEVRQQSARFVSPLHFPQTVGNYVAGALARAYALKGPNVTLAGGAASGLRAAAEACRWLNEDRAEIVIAGGVDTLTPPLSKAVASKSDILSEGACFLVFERQSHADRRGRRILGTVVAHGTGVLTTNDMTAEDTPYLSVAGFPLAGAVYVQAAIGHCLAALGTATVAAAIGSVLGLRVPFVEQVNPLIIRDTTSFPTEDSALRSSTCFRCIASNVVEAKNAIWLSIHLDQLGTGIAAE